MISTALGEITAYALDGLPDRGIMFVKPGDRVYEGMIVGEHCEQNDISVMSSRPKRQPIFAVLLRIRESNFLRPENFHLKLPLSIFEDDELVEVTPKTFRIEEETPHGKTNVELLVDNKTLEPMETSSERRNG